MTHNDFDSYHVIYKPFFMIMLSKEYEKYQKNQKSNSKGYNNA